MELNNSVFVVRLSITIVRVNNFMQIWTMDPCRLLLLSRLSARGNYADINKETAYYNCTTTQFPLA